MIWGQLSYGDIYYQPTDVHRDIVVQQNVFEDIERQKCVKTFFENSFGPKLRVQAKRICSVLHTAAILEMLQRQQAARLSSQSAERRTASYIIVERYL